MPRPDSTQISAAVRPWTASVRRMMRSRIRASAVEALPEVADVYLKEILVWWPSTHRRVHRYATDASLRRFYLEKVSDLRWVISNNAQRKGRYYARYPRRGYTQRGAETARSYAIRGNMPYDVRARIKIVGRARKIWAEALRRRWR